MIKGVKGEKERKREREERERDRERGERGTVVMTKNELYFMVKFSHNKSIKKIIGIETETNQRNQRSEKVIKRKKVN